MILMSLIQAGLFLRTSWREAGRLGISQKKRRACLRSATLTALGPSLSPIIIMISSYAFLGLGLETGTAEWGAMFINANKLMFSHPQFLVYPGLCILFAAAGFNLFGEALRDICAPREG